MSSTELDALLALLDGLPRPAADDLAAMREMATQMGAMFPVPADVEVEEVELSEASALRLRPPGAVADLALLHLHGGGFVSGSAAAFAGLTARLAVAAEAAALSVDYRLAPEHPFPAALEDALSAWDALVGEGYDPSSIVVVGDSAGGGLGLALVLALRAANRPLPGRWVGLSPWIDLTCPEPDVLIDDPLVDLVALRRAADWYAGAALDDPLVSPALADPGGLPPLLIQIGGREVLRPAAEAFAVRAEAAGVDVELQVWPELVHVWHLFAGMPEAEAAIAAIGAILRRDRTAARS